MSFFGYTFFTIQSHKTYFVVQIQIQFFYEFRTLFYLVKVVYGNIYYRDNYVNTLIYQYVFTSGTCDKVIITLVL